MQNGNRRDRKNKKEEREGWREINGAEHTCIIRDYESFIYFSIFVRNMIFSESFQFGMGSSSWFIPYKSFLNLFQSEMWLYLTDCLPYLSDLLAGIWSNFLAVDHVIYLWLSAQYFSLGKDAASCLFCYIFNMKEEFYKYIMSLNLIIWNSLEIEFAESWRFLKIIFLKLYFQVFEVDLVWLFWPQSLHECSKCEPKSECCVILEMPRLELCLSLLKIPIVLFNFILTLDNCLVHSQCSSKTTPRYLTDWFGISRFPGSLKLIEGSILRLAGRNMSFVFWIFRHNLLALN